MDNLEEGILDYAYLTIEDFLNSRHIRTDDVEHNASSDNLDFHFNKPGFDLAIILTDEALLSSISNFQAPFHKTCRLTTHVIYVPNISRLKHCIIELKKMEILYAVIVNKNSHVDDDYDVFILYELIECQMRMRIKEAMEFICNDYKNYVTELLKILRNPDRCPHAKNRRTEGFIEPSSEIRYLLCLLFDGRVLEMKELQELRKFVQSRKEAIERMGSKPVNYGINDRPVPAYRQDTLKYYIYELTPKVSNHADGRNGKSGVPSNIRKDECLAGSGDSDQLAKAASKRHATQHVVQPLLSKPVSQSNSQTVSPMVQILKNTSPYQTNKVAPQSQARSISVPSPANTTVTPSIASTIVHTSGPHNVHTPSQNHVISKSSPVIATALPPQTSNISPRSGAHSVPPLSIKHNKNPPINPSHSLTNTLTDSQLNDIPLPSQQYNEHPTSQTPNIHSPSTKVTLPSHVNRTINPLPMQSITPQPQANIFVPTSQTRYSSPQQYHMTIAPQSNNISPQSYMYKSVTTSQPQYIPPVSQQYYMNIPPQSNNISPQSYINQVVPTPQPHFISPTSQHHNAAPPPQSNHIYPQPQIDMCLTPSQIQYITPACQLFDTPPLAQRSSTCHQSPVLPSQTHYISTTSHQYNNTTISPSAINISPQSLTNQVLPLCQSQYISPTSQQYSGTLAPQTNNTSPQSQTNKVVSSSQLPVYPTSQMHTISHTHIVNTTSRPSKDNNILAKLNAMKMAHEAKSKVTSPEKSEHSISSSSVNSNMLTGQSKVELKHSPGTNDSGVSDVSSFAVRKVNLRTQFDRNCPDPTLGQRLSSGSSDLSDNDNDGRDITYNLSPISDDPREDEPLKDIKIEIDLTDDCVMEASTTSCPPAKKFKLNSPLKPTHPTLYLIDLAEDLPSVKPKPIKVSCNMLVNLFKFVINLSPLQLSPQNAVLHMLQTCLVDMKKYSSEIGLANADVDLRSCRMTGCRDIIRIIESLCGEAISSKDNVEDLSFMWSYFPKNVTEDSVTIVFYKLMKVLELSGLGSTPNDLLMNVLQRLQKIVNYNFQLTESSQSCCNDLNHFPSMFEEYFNLREELHSLNLALPPPGPPSATLNSDFDMVIAEHRITFVMGPLMEYFIGTINSIHYQLDTQAMEVIYGAMRAFRFCMRKICVRTLPEHLQPSIQFIAPGNLMDRTLELLDEINYVIREVTLLNCVLFTKKHYDFVNLILDFTIKVEKAVTGESESDFDFFDKQYLIHLDCAQFMHTFSSNLKAAVWPYHQDTEIEVFKKALKNRWIDVLHEVFKGIPPEPDGSRISREVSYLLPKFWGKHTFDEAVIEAATLSYSDWEKMLMHEGTASRLLYSDVRNNYLIWLSNNGLEHRKAMQLMTANQKLLDAKILQAPL